MFSEEVVKDAKHGYILKVKRTGFADKLDVGRKRKKIQEESKVFRLSSCKNETQFRFPNQGLFTLPLKSREREL